jgi:DNA-binding NarL/FixJ family response regulator
MSDAITVMVVDDHPIWREGVARDLTERGLKIVATAPDADAAVRIARAVRPQVVLMDLNLGGWKPAEPAGWGGGSATSGVRAIEGILAELPETKVLVLSASGEHTDVLEAVKAGATGYLVKSASAEELLAAVLRTAEGFPVFTPGLAGLVLGEYRRLADMPDGSGGVVPALTERETEVLRLVAKGLTAKQIGERLVLSHRTVESHVQNTLRKLQLHNRVQLVRYAIEQGLADE